MRLFLCFVYICLPAYLLSAKVPENILKLLEGKDAKTQVRILDSLAEDLRNKDFLVSAAISKYSLSISKRNTLNKNVVKTYLALCRTYRVKGIYDTALIYVDSARAFAIQKKLSDQYGGISDTEGLVYMRLSNYEKATICFYQSISYSETIHDSLKLRQATEHLGSVSFYRHDYANAVKFYKQALRYFPGRQESLAYFSTLDNIGLAYSNLKVMDSALHYQRQGVQALEKMKDSVLMAESYINIGSTLLELKRFKESELYFTKANLIHTRLNNVYGTQLSNLYLGRMYLKSGRAQQSLVYLEKAYSIAQKLKLPAQLKESLTSLTTAYEATGDYKKSLQYYDLLVTMIEDLYKQENSIAINELSTQYETKKKQQEIQLLTSEKEVQRQRIGKDRYVKLFIGSLASLLLILSLVFIFRFRKKRKDNLLLLEKNQAIALQKEKIEQQKELLQDKNKEITDSINYAKRIQASVIPSSNLIKRHFPESFIYFQPKDIVSGDFYWLCENNGNIFFAIVDCTGHGVPGAMMAMLGASLLNHIVLNSKIESPAEILKQLHQDVLKTLNENMDLKESKDGMDIALIRLDKLQKKLFYSGAGRNLYLIKNNSLQIYKCDKNSIGDSNSSAQINYQLHSIDITEPVQLYLFSDGVPDQFGGPNGKKLNTKNLLSFLQNSSTHSTSQQETEFKIFFEEWKGNTEQTDDVTLVTIRLD